jgi:hypothetical protein
MTKLNLKIFSKQTNHGGTNLLPIAGDKVTPKGGGLRRILWGNGKRKAITIIIACVILGLIGFGVSRIFMPQSGPAVITSDSSVPAFASCGTTNNLLKQSPINIDQLSTIIPLGNFAPPGHVIPTEHMYYNYLNIPLADGTPTPAKTTLYVPADMTVTRITLFDNQSATKPFDSYRLDFTVCKEVTGYFIHILQLNDKLKAAMSKPYDQTQTSDAGGGMLEHTYGKVVDVKLTAGEVLGSGGGGAGLPGGLDIGLYDSRTAMPTFANPERWKQDNKIVCSLDYFPTDISKALYSHIGDYTFKFIEPGDPKCGQVYQDIPGSAQGVWFGSDSPKDQIGEISHQLTLGHSNFNHAKGTFALGDAVRQIGIDPTAVYAFTPTTSGQQNLDFGLVKPGSTVYCYQTVNNNGEPTPGPVLILQLVDSNTLRLGTTDTTVCGAGPWIFTEHIDYVR